MGLATRFCRQVIIWCTYFLFASGAYFVTPSTSVFLTSKKGRLSLLLFLAFFFIFCCGFALFWMIALFFYLLLRLFITVIPKSSSINRLQPIDTVNSNMIATSSFKVSNISCAGIKHLNTTGHNTIKFVTSSDLSPIFV